MSLPLVPVLSLFLLGAPPPGWTLDKSSDGIEVVTRSEKGWGLKAYRASMKVKVKMDAAVALVADIDALPQWYTDCSQNKLLKRISGKEMVTYFVNDSPFPVMDRDNAIRTIITQDPATRAVTFAMKGEPNFLPEDDDRVRIPRFEGSWVFIPVSDTETEIIHEVRSDTGGSVPSFLANQQVTVGPFKTLQKMRRMLEKPRYKNATVNYEDAAVTYGK